MERVESLHMNAFARLVARLMARMAAHQPTAGRISRLDIAILSEDQLRDIGLMDGRRPRGGQAFRRRSR